MLEGLARFRCDSEIFTKAFCCSKNHSPAARRSGKSASSRGSDSHVCMTLNKQSLCELRSMQQLPQKLLIVVEALCVLLGLQVDSRVPCRLFCADTTSARCHPRPGKSWCQSWRLLVPAKEEVVPCSDATCCCAASKTLTFLSGFLTPISCGALCS